MKITYQHGGVQEDIRCIANAFVGQIDQSGVTFLSGFFNQSIDVLKQAKGQSLELLLYLLSLLEEWLDETLEDQCRPGE